MLRRDIRRTFVANTILEYLHRTREPRTVTGTKYLDDPRSVARLLVRRTIIHRVTWQHQLTYVTVMDHTRNTATSTGSMIPFHLQILQMDFPMALLCHLTGVQAL